MIRDRFGRYQRELMTKQAELELLLCTLDSIAVQHSADELDNVQLSAEREFAIKGMERWTALFEEVREALNRINNGTYGVCRGCHDVINPRRLMAVPWTAYCLRCQEGLDRHADELRAEEPAYSLTPLRLKRVAERSYMGRRRYKTASAGSGPYG